MKVVQIGIGGMGDNWLKTVLRSQTVEYAGFVEINPDIARTQADTYGLDESTIFKSLPEAIARLELDAVIDVTPPQFHKEHSIIALEAGLPVLSEKPLAQTLDDARAIVAKAEETGLLHMVAQNYRYRPVTQTIKALLDSGELGDIASLRAEFYRAPRFGGFREEMPHPLIIDMAIHHFDMMRYFLDSKAKLISARSWNPPWSWFAGDASASAIMQFENGVHASYSASWVSEGHGTSWNAHWRFDCEHGVMRVEDDVLSIHGPASGKPQTLPLLAMERESQDYLLREFYQAVSEGTAVGTSAQDNIHTMEMVFGAVRSCDEGITVELA